MGHALLLAGALLLLLLLVLLALLALLTLLLLALGLVVLLEKVLGLVQKIHRVGNVCEKGVCVCVRYVVWKTRGSFMPVAW